MSPAVTATGTTFCAARIIGTSKSDASLQHDLLSAPVEIVFTVIRRRRLGQVLALVRQFDADAFYSIDELQASSGPASYGGCETVALPHAASEPTLRQAA